LIYSKKYPLENGIELEGYSNLSFYIYEIENEIIGYGSYQINDMMYIVETIFTDEYKYKNEHISFLNYLYDSSKKTQKSLASVMNLTKSNSNLVLKCIV